MVRHLEAQVRRLLGGPTTEVPPRPEAPRGEQRAADEDLAAAINRQVDQAGGLVGSWKPSLPPRTRMTKKEEEAEAAAAAAGAGRSGGRAGIAREIIDIAFTGGPVTEGPFTGGPFTGQPR